SPASVLCSRGWLGEGSLYFGPTGSACADPCPNPNEPSRFQPHPPASSSAAPASSTAAPPAASSSAPPISPQPPCSAPAPRPGSARESLPAAHPASALHSRCAGSSP